LDRRCASWEVAPRRGWQPMSGRVERELGRARTREAREGDSAVDSSKPERESLANYNKHTNIRTTAREQEREQVG